jgi:hypothetical protein
MVWGRNFAWARTLHPNPRFFLILRSRQLTIFRTTRHRRGTSYVMNLPRLSAPALVVLAALLSACGGATSQLSPLSPGTTGLQPGSQPVLARGDAGDSSAVGYMSYTPAADDPPSDWDILLMRSVELRRALDDVQRLRILDDLRETEAGQLSGIAGPGFGISSTGYNLRRLLRAYKSTVEWDPDATLVLWRGDQKIGSFDDGGLTLLGRQ